MAKRKYSENAEHNEVINKLYAAMRELEDRNRQLQLALGDLDINCSWQQLVRDIGRKQPRIANILQQAYVKDFHRGRITLIFRLLSPQDVFIVKGELKRYLRLYTAQRWHQAFTIKIKITD